MASPAVSRKARKQNFSASEIAILTEKVEENLSIIQSKLTNSVTNQKKNEIWCKIADAVNAVGVARRTTTEVRENGKIYTHRPKKSSQNWPKSRKKLEEVKLRRCRRRQLLKSLTFSKKPHHSPASRVSSRKVRINIHCCLKLELLITLRMHKLFHCLQETRQIFGS